MRPLSSRLPDFDSVPDTVWQRCQLLYICSPGNPTGAVMSTDLLCRLLELAERFPFPLHHTLIVETGGMKGRGREMVKPELHNILQNAFSVDAIWAEYGMTELLSQAWSKGNGLYECPPWMKAILREEEDPLTLKNVGIGALNIIDLANIHSCCFIATEDAGRIHPNGQFEILGRMDGSDLRGCSLLVV